ncbi:MAG: PAC2 family protein [Candidatus Bathyarchaeota archaeon]|nr:PAC2 family protein [Candidatus Bathyarchaeota archaeon]
MGKAECMVLGFKGYSDAGLVVTFSVEYLLKSLGGFEKVKSFGEEFYDYMLSRPFVVVEDGLVKDVKLPRIDVFYSKNFNIIVVYGFEPSFKWFKLVDEVLSLIESFNVKKLYSLGGLIDYVSEPRVSGLVSSENLKNMLTSFGVELVNYTGPCSIYSVILDRLKRVNVEGVSLWGHVPYKNYLASTYLRTPDVLTAYQLLKKFTSISGVNIHLDNVLEECKRFKEKVEMLTMSGVLDTSFRGEDFYVT